MWICSKWNAQIPLVLSFMSNVTEQVQCPNLVLRHQIQWWQALYLWSSALIVNMVEGLTHPRIWTVYEQRYYPFCVQKTCCQHLLAENECLGCHFLSNRSPIQKTEGCNHMKCTKVSLYNSIFSLYFYLSCYTQIYAPDYGFSLS